MASIKDGDPLLQAIMAEARRQGMAGFDFSLDAGIAYSTLSSIVCGHTSPRLATVRKLLDAIDSDIMLVPRGERPVPTPRPPAPPARRCRTL